MSLTVATAKKLVRDCSPEAMCWMHVQFVSNRVSRKLWKVHTGGVTSPVLGEGLTRGMAWKNAAESIHGGALIDYRVLNWFQLSEVVTAVRDEVKRRNPIGVNLYTSGLIQAEKDLREIAEAEADHPTAENGPIEPKQCIHCRKTLQQHGGFARCVGGKTQFTPPT